MLRANFPASATSCEPPSITRPERLSSRAHANPAGRAELATFDARLVDRMTGTSNRAVIAPQSGWEILASVLARIQLPAHDPGPAQLRSSFVGLWYQFDHRRDRCDKVKCLLT